MTGGTYLFDEYFKSSKKVTFGQAFLFMKWNDVWYSNNGVSSSLRTSTSQEPNRIVVPGNIFCRP